MGSNTSRSVGIASNAEILNINNLSRLSGLGDIDQKVVNKLFEAERIPSPSLGHAGKLRSNLDPTI